MLYFLIIIYLTDLFLLLLLFNKKHGYIIDKTQKQP